MSEEKLVVIGGGILGVSTAYYLKLLSPKSQVVLLERHNEVGTGCSFQNGGIFDPWSSDPWTYPGTVMNTLTNWWKPAQHMQLTWNAVLNPFFWVWGTRFLISTFSSSKIEDSMELLAMRTFTLHQEFRQRHGDTLSSYSFKAPLLEVLADDHHVESYKKRLVAFNKKHNTNYVLLDSAACLEQEPELKTCDIPVKACVLNAGVTASNADSHDFTVAVAAKAQELGVQVIKGATVTGFERRDSRVTAVLLSDGTRIEGTKFVLSAGIESKALSKKLGWTLPLWAVKGYSYNIQTDRKFKHTIHLHGEQTVILNPMDSGVRHSFFAEFTHPEDYEINQQSIDIMSERVAKMLKVTQLERTSYWTGLRPASSDDLPIIGQFPKLTNVFLNTGHGSRGLILGLGSSELTAQLVLNRIPVLKAGDYSPNRFWL
eukprot:CAMPEP_0204902684 /NCGR_PEP_ID=MMETSP1397-20131031/3813_1 /ASSEMBLY_ACC=CAM_ASM_000891 /TAXON_ID=49980 /ORGANISM="Climacostomum Climacostomum virens, Strain Stock W-24" /LENGTH=428 /DNA_ID=CAMNT_0052071221 /DNA_START=17 /DNA_END=1303 /DNA_ORIENTATION=+